MAAAPGRTNPAVSEVLFREPYRFDFFQAVRLLEQLFPDREPVGGDAAPERESVRFKAVPSLSFPAGSIHDLKQPKSDPSSVPPPELSVGFFGLFGPSGVLPTHYTSTILARQRLKDSSLRDWMDLFNHRLLSLYHRAWEKYRLPVMFERGPREGREPDPVTGSLYALTGFGTDGLRERLQTSPAALLYYSGLFAHHPRPAVSLEGMLEDYFDLPIRVEQLQGRWLHLAEADRGRFPRAGRRKGGTNCLGEALVIGQRVWDVQSKVRLKIGPVGYDQFRRLMPDGDGLIPLCEMARLYVGDDLDFDVQPILKAAEVPKTRVAASGLDRSRLGWNTWLRYGPMARDADQAVFAAKPV